MTTDEPYKAPIPLIHEVDDVKLRPIKAKLKADPPEPITMEEATLLLQSTTYLAIKGLSQVYDAKLDWKEVVTSGKPRWDAHGPFETQVIDPELELYHGHAPRHWGRFVRAKCDNTLNLVDALLQELPDSMVRCLTTHHFALEDHLAIIVSLPITEDGAVSTRHFIIDPTLGQLFYKGSGRLHEVGERMDKLDANFAKNLLSNGYAELTEAHAKTYVSAFSPEIVWRRAKEVFAECQDSHLNFLLHHENGYVRLPIYDHPVAGDDTMQR